MDTPSSKRSKYDAFLGQDVNSNASTPRISPEPLSTNASTPYLLTDYDVQNETNSKNWLKTIDTNTLVGMNAKSHDIPFFLGNEILKNKLLLIGNTHGNKQNNLTSDLNFETVDHTNKRKREGGRKLTTIQKKKQNNKKKLKKTKKTNTKPYWK